MLIWVIIFEMCPRIDNGRLTTLGSTNVPFSSISKQVGLDCEPLQQGYITTVCSFHFQSMKVTLCDPCPSRGGLCAAAKAQGELPMGDCSDSAAFFPHKNLIKCVFFLKRIDYIINLGRVRRLAN